MDEDSFREIPFEVLGLVISWISEEEQAIVNQVSKNFQFIVNKDKFNIQILTAVSSISLLQWSLRNGLPGTDKVTESSIINGKLDVLRHLVVKLNYPLPYHASYWAAKEGRLEVLRALRNGELGGVCPLDEWVCRRAAQRGHLGILRALRSGELGEICPWDEWACSLASYEGHLEVLRALRSGELGGVCPWNKEECLDDSLYRQEIQDAILSGELDD